MIFVVERNRKVFPPHGPCVTLGITKIVAHFPIYKMDIVCSSSYGCGELRCFCAENLGIYRAVSI